MNENVNYIRQIFCTTETYSKAQELSRRAEVTSNVETEPEVPKRRATKKPARYDLSDESEGTVILLRYYILWFVMAYAGNLTMVSSYMCP